MTNSLMTRRTTFGMGASAAAATTVRAAAIVPCRFDDPIWNREAAARLQADTNGSQVYGHCSGIICGVRPAEAVRPLVGFEVFSTIRVLRQADGSYQRMTKETIIKPARCWTCGITPTLANG